MKQIETLGFSLFHLLVELQGIEPWSKHATNRLSTCLLLYWFSIKNWESTPKIL